MDLTPLSCQNEKKKDKDLTERIARILKQRDDVVSGVDMSTFKPSYVYHARLLTF
jgi:hypothetical protein